MITAIIFSILFFAVLVASQGHRSFSLYLYAISLAVAIGGFLHNITEMLRLSL